MKTSRSSHIAGALAFLGLFPSAPLKAQTWTVTNLHPANATASSLRHATGTRQVGTATVNGLTQGSLWASSAASFTFVLVNAEGSSFAATTGAGQAGYGLINGLPRAVVRNGTSGLITYRSLGTATRSEIYAASGTQEVGYAYIDGIYHAVSWSAPNFNLQDLHPFGAQASEAYATTGTQQGGYATIDGVRRAMLWTPSRVDLHPVNAGASAVYAMSGSQQGVGQQAGYASIGGAIHAAIWAGTKASFRDLHPPGATQSLIYATTGSQQAGSATIGGNGHAAFWTGSAATFEDLHRFLPGRFSSSIARGIWTDGSAVLVAGSAFNSVAARNEAMLWRFTPNRAPTFTIVAKSTKPTTRAKVTIRGTRADPDGTTPKVFVKIGKAKFRLAKGGGSNWTFTAKLDVGRNPVQIYAQDAGGLRSPTRRLKIIRHP